MPHKNKTAKKKDVGKRKQNYESDKGERKNLGKGLILKGAAILVGYFSNEDLQEIKNVIKSKDLSNVPLLLAAVILNKFDVIRDLVRNSCNVNETGPNHVTALMWAVKCRNIEIIDFLLSHGADPTIKNDSGDNVLFLALENKLWGEKSYITLWNRIKNVSFVDVDFVGKNGRNMVHTAVKREWSRMVKILILEKANINAENSTGMTPLMLASYFNNLDIVSALLEAKADVLKEDANGCTALCYAISYVINKNDQMPHSVVEKLVTALGMRNLTFKEFFKSRINSILNSTVKQNRSGQPLPDTKSFIISYMLQFTKSGLGTLAEVDIFQKIAQAVERYIRQPIQMMKLLTIINEILKHCERYIGIGVIAGELFGTFIMNGTADSCLSVLKMYGFDNTHDYDFISSAFAALLTVSVSCSEGQLWLYNNFFDVLPFYKTFLTKNPVENNSGDTQTKRNNEKILKFNELIDDIQQHKKCFKTFNVQQTSELVKVRSNPQKSEEYRKSDHSTKESKQESKSNPKKTKRRARALKAKIAKIKNADLQERLNQQGRKILKQKFISDTTLKQKVETKNDARFKPWSKHSAWEQIWFIDNSNSPPVQEFNNTLAILENEFITEVKDQFFNKNFEMKIEYENEQKMEYEKTQTPENHEVVSLYPDWKNKSLSPAVNTAKKFTNKSTHTTKNEKKQSKSFEEDEIDLAIKPSQEEVKDLLSYTLNYLSGLFKKIIITYHKHWEQDKELERVFKNDRGDVTAQYEQASSTMSITEKLEIEHIQRVQTEFDKLIWYIKNNADKHFVLCSKLIDKLEAILLNHKIRGKSIIQDTVMQVININEDLGEALSSFSEAEQDISVPKYVENLLNTTRWDKNTDDDMFDINYPTAGNFDSEMRTRPDTLYLQEVLALPSREPPNLEKLKSDKIKTMKSAYHLMPSIINVCDDSEEAITTKREDTAKRERSNSNSGTSKYKTRQTLQETLSAVPKTDHLNNLLEALEHTQGNSEGQSLVENTSRWCTIIRSLRMMKSYQVLLHGDIRISNDTDDSHTISTGGNFSPVILGLDARDRPLAVKRIRKENAVCKTMKNLLYPLLGLRNTNLLHYFSCNYEKNELILATPLCEYNMGEYLMVMKQSPNMYVKSINTVKQFLAGLRFLHDRADPIVHGNLKPSNIFIDFSGIVRIAEFGMHKALYTLTDASNSSIIWFARETFAKFKEISSIVCTCASDIQVAGMLIHFILTAGKHPYGELTLDILKNLERAIPQLVTTDVDLHDLISWMLLYEPSERPSINQVLSHVFFWSTDRKWRFILTCAGVSPHGTPLNVPLNELHLYINIVAARENIKGRWINITKRRFPNLTYSKNDRDSIIGFLRFIRNCMQNQAALHLNTDSGFRNFILSSFPALPLSLYRILECSQWLNHHVLQPFTTVDSLSA